MTHDLGSRVLLLPPTRRDGTVACNILAQVGLRCEICESIHEMASKVDEGAGVIILSDDAFSRPDTCELIDVLKEQPAWSDVPTIVLTKNSRDQPKNSDVLAALSNLTFIERPAPMRSLVSAVQTAVRARNRQYEMREQLRNVAQAAEQFELMADAISQLAWMANADGEIFWYNRRWKEYTGTSLEETGGWNWSKLHHPDYLPIVLQKWNEALLNGIPFEMEFPLKGKDGNFRMFLTRAEPLRNENGELFRWLGTNTDIEERRQMQASREIMLEAERSARLEAERAARIKDEFVATLSHELRTPLSAILGWAYLIRLKANEPAVVTDGAQVIERNGRALTQLVEDLLDLSRIITGKLRLNLEKINLGDVISKAVESLQPSAEAKHIEILVDIADSPNFFFGDSVRLQQVVWNLVSNSVKFTSDQGKIEVSLKYTRGAAIIRVADNGEGIDVEFLPHLFDRFSQADASAARKHGGLGIGLSLVRQLVEAHSGEVSVQSLGKGQGSTFTIVLPLNLKPAQRLVSQDSLLGYNAIPKIAGVRILIVDDEPEVRTFVERLLTETGASVSSCGSSREALLLIEGQPPSLLISDIGMPGEDGYDFLRKVRLQGFTMPAIALTAFVRPEDRDRAILAGFQHHLPKPIDPGHLLRLVEELVG